MSQIAPRDAGLELVTYFGTGNTVWLERYLHEAFSHRRVRGEWFYLSVADVRLLKSIGVEVNTVDELPSALVAQWVLNEAKGFEWGERNDKALVPVKHCFNVTLSEETQQAIDAYIAAQPQHKRPTRANLLTAAVRLLLSQEGFWPPK